jgi:hypothetical protein
MLSALLRGDRAVQMSIAIVRTLVPGVIESVRERCFITAATARRRHAVG